MNGVAMQLIKQAGLPAPPTKDKPTMKHFTIDAENNITIHASRKEAQAVADRIAFSTEEQFADGIGNDGKRLIDIWNSLPGVTPVKKFTNRKIATERIWRAIQNLKCEAPPAAPAPEPEVIASVSAQAPDVAPPEVASTIQATPKAAREGSKTATILALVRQTGGATLNEIMTATGWQAHSVRGFISGSLTKKMGLKVESIKRADGQRAYLLAQ
jgi:hypothetical protein